MKLVLIAAAALIFSSCAVCQDNSCFDSEALAAFVPLAGTCSNEGINLLSDSGPDIAAVCALPLNSPCRSGLNDVFAPCGFVLDEDFCSLLPANFTMPAPTATMNPDSFCFSREDIRLSFTQLTLTCQNENINLGALFSTTPEALCTLPEGSCRSGFIAILTSCDTTLELFCIIANAPTPSPSQEACVNNSEMARAADIDRDCGSSENLFNIDLLRARCATGSPCRTLLNEIFVESCGYDPLSPICDNLPPPTDIPTPITDDPMTVCLNEEATLRALEQLQAGDCQNVYIDSVNRSAQICSLDKGSPCRVGLTKIFSDCDIPLDAVCAFESLPTPSPSQQECLTRVEQNRAADIMRECGSIEVNSFAEIQSLCANGGCRSFLQSIFGDGCGYDVVNTVCDSLSKDGAVNLYAVPLVVLIAALMSVVF